MTSLKDALNLADLNSLADMLRALGLGSMLRALPTFLRRSAAAASPYNLAAAFAVSAQVQDAPAAQIISAYARAGSGTPAQLVVDAPFTTPVAGHVAIAPNGAIVTAAADAWTDVDVVYVADKGEILEVSLPVAAGILTLPPNFTVPGAVTLLEAEALTGTTTGKCAILIPGAAPGTTLQANLNTAKSQVLFKVADAIATARVRLLVSSKIDVNALLAADATIL